MMKWVSSMELVNCNCKFKKPYYEICVMEVREDVSWAKEFLIELELIDPLVKHYKKKNQRVHR